MRCLLSSSLITTDSINTTGKRLKNLKKQVLQFRHKPAIALVSLQYFKYAIKQSESFAGL